MGALIAHLGVPTESSSGEPAGASITASATGVPEREEPPGAGVLAASSADRARSRGLAGVTPLARRVAQAHDIAVAPDEGLVVATVRGADVKSLGAVAAESREPRACRAGARGTGHAGGSRARPSPCPTSARSG